jgi:hypothetical protein
MRIQIKQFLIAVTHKIKSSSGLASQHAHRVFVLKQVFYNWEIYRVGGCEADSSA